MNSIEVEVGKFLRNPLGYFSSTMNNTVPEPDNSWNYSIYNKANSNTDTSVKFNSDAEATRRYPGGNNKQVGSVRFDDS